MDGPGPTLYKLKHLLPLTAQIVMDACGFLNKEKSFLNNNIIESDISVFLQTYSAHF